MCIVVIQEMHSLSRVVVPVTLRIVAGTTTLDKQRSRNDNSVQRMPRNGVNGTTKNRTIVKSTIKNKTLKLNVNGTTKGQIYKLITCKHMQNMMCFFIRITTKKLFSLYNKHKRYLYIDHFTVRKPNLKTNLDF